MTAFAVSLEMRPVLPLASARLMRTRDVSWASGADPVPAMAYPFLFLESMRTMPTSDAEMMNSTTPMPNRAVRCRPLE